MIKSVRMVRKFAFILTGLVILLAALFAGTFGRPVLITDHGETRPIRAWVWSTGQALAAAEIQLDPADEVQPALNQPVPFNRQIRIRRAVQLLLWEEGAAPSTRRISGFETSPTALLQANSVSIGSQDRLLWNGQPVTDSTVLPAGKPVLLQLIRAKVMVFDRAGERSQITSSMPTTASALWDAGVRPGPGDRFSVPLNAPLPANEMVAYQPASMLEVQMAGQQVRVRSSAATVGQALAEAGVPLQNLDYSEPADDQPLPADGKIRVVRVREEITLKETLVPYTEQFAPDPNMELDQRGVTQAGQYGVQVTRERARFEDGQEVSRAADSDWVASEPVPQTLGYGTKIVTKTLDTPDGQIEYWRAARVYATSYSPCRLGTSDNRCGYTTASGLPLTKGIIGTSLSWFRQMRGQRVYVEGYGFGVIGDYGAVSGMRIDLGFDEDNFEQGAFVGWTTMYFLTPTPANIPWTLP